MGETLSQLNQATQVNPTDEMYLVQTSGTGGVKANVSQLLQLVASGSPVGSGSLLSGALAITAGPGVSVAQNSANAFQITNTSGAGLSSVASGNLLSGAVDLVALAGITVSQTAANVFQIGNASGSATGLSSGAVQSGNLASGAFQVQPGAGIGVQLNSANSVSLVNLSGTLESGQITSGYLGSGAFQVNAGTGITVTLTGNNIFQVANASGSFALTSGCVISSYIASGQVGQYALANGSVGSGQVISGFAQITGHNGTQVSLTGDNIWVVANTSGSLLSGQITSGFIGNGAIVSGTIASGCISLLGGSGIYAQWNNPERYTITVSGLTSGMLLSGSVNSGNITSGSIGNYALASGIIVSGYLGSGAVSVTAGTGITVTLTGNNIFQVANASGSFALTSGCIISSYIASGQVGGDALASGAVNSGALASGAFKVQTGGTGISATILSANTISLSIASGATELTGTGGVEISTGLQANNFTINGIPYYSTLLSGSSATPNTICQGSDGLLWFIDVGVWYFSTSGTFQPFTSGWTNSTGCCLGSDGNIWATDSPSSGAIWKVTSGGGTFTKFNPSFGSGYQPGLICNGGDGNLWITPNSFGPKLWRISTAGTLLNTFTFGSGLGALVSHPDGNVYVTDEYAGYVYRVTPTGTTTQLLLSGSEPNAICVGPDNNLWITDPSVPQIWKLTLSGNTTIYQASGLSLPDGICTGPDGNLWISDSSAKSMFRFTPYGAVTQIKGFQSPYCACTGPDNNLYVADPGLITDNIAQVIVQPNVAVSGSVYSGSIVGAAFASGLFVGGPGISVTQNAANVTINNLSGNFTLTSGCIVSGYIASGQVGAYALAANAIQSGNVGSGALSITGVNGVSAVLTGNNIWQLSNTSGGAGGGGGLSSGAVTSGYLGSGAVAISGTSGLIATLNGNNGWNIGALLPQYCNCRLSLQSGVPITTTDVSGSNIYITPYNGNLLWIGGTPYNFSQLVLPCQQLSVSGLCRGTTAIVSGLLSTSGLAVGMQCSGTGITANTTITQINTANSLTLSTNVGSTGSGHNNTLSFSLPASNLSATNQQSGSVWDVWSYAISGAPAVQFGTKFSGGGRMDPLTLINGQWCNQNIINSGNWNSINSGAGAYLGTCCVGGQAGYIVDAQQGGTQSGGMWSGGQRLLWNNYNRVLRTAQIVEALSQWVMVNTANIWQMVDYTNVSGVGGGANRVDIVIGLQTEMARGTTHNYYGVISGGNYVGSIGINSTVSGICRIGGFGTGTAGPAVVAASEFNGYLSVGYNALSWLEMSNNASQDGFGFAIARTSGAIYGQAGMEVICWM